MYANKKQLDNVSHLRLIVSPPKQTFYHFKNAACRREALASLDRM
jgi:hypothetical protein